MDGPTGKRYTIFQFNGKDVFLRSVEDEDDFVVMSHQELTQEFLDLIIPGRVVLIREDGTIDALKTPAEVAAELDKKLRQTQCQAAIRGLEEMGEENLPPYAMNKLKLLRKEYEQYEPLDPTAVSFKLKRTNASCEKDKKP